MKYRARDLAQAFRTTAIVSGISLATASILLLDLVIDVPGTFLCCLLAAVKLTLVVFTGVVTLSKLLPLLYRRQRLMLALPEAAMIYVPGIMLYMIAVTVAAGFMEFLYSETIIVFAVMPALLAASVFPRNRVRIRMDKMSGGLALLLTPMLLAACCGLAILLLFTPGQWDAMTYHLYIPARWLQEAKIFHVPTYFGTSAPAYSPGNSFAFYACVMGLLNSDFLMNCLSLLFLWLTGFALFRLLSNFTGSTVSAAFPGILIATAPLLLFRAFTAYADVIAMALLFSATALLARYLMRPRCRDAVLCAAICGMAAGTKTGILPYVLPLLAVLGVTALFNKDWKTLLWAAVAAMLGGGWWYVRNVYLYGNPLFPIEFKIAGTRLFGGLYAAETLAHYGLGATGLREVWTGLLRYFDPASLALAPLGFIGWLFALRHRRFRPAVIFVIGLLLFWIYAFFFINPYNTVFRFLLPSWILAVAGLGVLLDLIKSDKIKIAALLPVLGYFLIYDIYNYLFVIRGFRWELFAFSFVLSAVLAGLAVLWLMFRKNALLPVMLAVVLALFAWSGHLSDWLRNDTLGRSVVGAFRPAFQLFNRNDNIMPPATIAYTGMNVPYIFIGPHLKNRVVYCDVSTENGWGMHDFWEKSGKPCLDSIIYINRLKPNFWQWLNNLNSAGANVLAVMQVHPAERKRIRHTRDFFPLERVWASRWPDIFKPCVKSKNAEIYSIDRKRLDAVVSAHFRRLKLAKSATNAATN